MVAGDLVAFQLGQSFYERDDSLVGRWRQLVQLFHQLADNRVRIVVELSAGGLGHEGQEDGIRGFLLNGIEMDSVGKLQIRRNLSTRYTIGGQNVEIQKR